MAFPNIYTEIAIRGIKSSDCEIKDKDSDIVILAKGVMITFLEKDGVSDEMSSSEIRFIDDLMPYAEKALDVLIRERAI